MAYKAYIFDCDGTVLDTLPDLVALTNAALAEFGLAPHTPEEILGFVGFGAARLIERAVPAGMPPAETARVLERWRALYPEYGFQKTVPYPGMPQALSALAARGARLAVLSNKFDAATREVVERYYPGVFDAVHGEREGVPRKPDPHGLLLTLDELGCAPEDAVYVGDSPVDVQVAARAGTASIAVGWGYNPVDALVGAGARTVVSTPAELLTAEG